MHVERFLSVSRAYLRAPPDEPSADEPRRAALAVALERASSAGRVSRGCCQQAETQNRLYGLNCAGSR
jgi:hypothetical protein